MLRLFALLFILAPGAVHAQGVALLDRIVAVVNKEVVTLSELNDTIATAERQLRRERQRRQDREE